MEQTPPLPLARIPANRRLVDALYAHKKIDRAARDDALAFLYPAEQWGLWISRLFLSVGVALVLSGVAYFFAFNWAKITPLMKFSVLQLAMAGCLLGAYYYRLERISGQVLLLSASVLVGVFLAVFGQIYQTGADAFQLFMMWSLLIFGWTVISNFAAQWVLWLAVTNVFVVLWWEQAFLPDHEQQALIFALIAVLNLSALLLREAYVAWKSAPWLAQRWVRALLVVAVLLPASIPVVELIFAGQAGSASAQTSAILGSVILAGVYFLYRFKLRDMWALAAVALSVCVILEALVLDFLAETLKDEIAMFLLMGLASIAVFSLAVLYLRKVILVLEADHG